MQRKYSLLDKYFFIVQMPCSSFSPYVHNYVSNRNRDSSFIFGVEFPNIARVNKK